MERASSDRARTEQTGPATRRTRFVCISDTHNANIALPKGDVIIHAGDLTNRGSYAEHHHPSPPTPSLTSSLGNHEITLDEPYYNTIKTSFPPGLIESSPKCLSLLTSSPSITYLSHTSATIKLTSPTGPLTTFTVFGSPSSPKRGPDIVDFSAFTYDTTPSPSSEPAAPTLWDAIPPNTDIVVTHTPPRHHLDTVPNNGDPVPIGCESLRRALWRVRPRLAVCGHVHFGRGAEYVSWGHGEGEELSTEKWIDPAPEGKKNCLVDLVKGLGSEQRGRGWEGTCVVNASIMTESYFQRKGHRKMSKPIVVDLELPVWR